MKHAPDDFSDLTAEEIVESMESLVTKGLVERVRVNGKMKYRLTEAGKIFADHMESDPSKRN